MVTDEVCNLGTFGDIVGGITNGITLRHVNGAKFNIFNTKTNAELKGIAHDLDFHAALNPIQGQDGLVCRLTFGGQNKMGSIIRLGPGDDLQCLVNDNLSSINMFTIMAEGHITVPQPP
jgi:hypothetical protein